MDSRAVLLGSLLGVLFVVLLLDLDKYEREPVLKTGSLLASSILATGLYGAPWRRSPPAVPSPATG